MSYLVDTNVVLRWMQPHDPLSPVATAAIDQLRRKGELVHLSAQNVIELWSVATRPQGVNGLGLSPAQVAMEVDRIEALFSVLDDVPGIYRHWRRLVQSCTVSGRQVHDARLVAVMLAHGVNQILTFNTDDFRRYPGIVVVSPHDVATAPGP
jgi:predicted nucleic acid-binding protein